MELRRSRVRGRLLGFLARRGAWASRATFGVLVIAIAAGAGFQIPNAANLAGFADAMLENNLVRGYGDVRVTPRDRARFEDGAAIVARLRAEAGVRAAVPALVYAGAVGRDGRFLGTPVLGLDALEPRPYALLRGEHVAPGDARGAVVGATLARRLDVDVGGEVDVRAVFAAADPLLGEDNLGRFRMIVRGIASSASGAYRAVFVDRAALAKEAGEPRAASIVAVHLDDHYAATAAAARIEAALPEVRAIGWREDDPYIDSYLAMGRVLGRVSYAMVVAAVAVPVWALLYIHMLKRRRELAILAALGFRRWELFALYVVQGAGVAVLGIAVGTVLGYGLIRYFEGAPIFVWETFVMRPVVAAGTFAIPSLVIAVTAIAAAAYPAWRAARIDPARVLRRLE